jgi:hypothetical protein
MDSRETIITRLRQVYPALKQRYPIESLAVFGSVARSEAGPRSDLDVLVTFAAPVSLSTFLALEDEIKALTGREVDLVSEQTLKPYMRRSVMRDLVLV